MQPIGIVYIDLDKEVSDGICFVDFCCWDVAWFLSVCLSARTQYITVPTANRCWHMSPE